MGSESQGLVRLRRALLSVSDTTGLVALARQLSERSVELLATSGTRAHLERASLKVRPAEELTGIGDWFGGRIKTLHPGLLGGILAPRTEAGAAELASRNLLPIDLVVVNFYPFAHHLSESPGATDAEEFIDVGGVTLARAAAKNHASVAVVSDPSDYPELARDLDEFGGATTSATRRRLARAAFARTSAYDRAIATHLAGAATAEASPESLSFEREPLELRYGENPHQRAAVYRLRAGPPMEPAALRSLKGSSLSFTNLLDLDTAAGVVAELDRPAAAVVKHATPCGVATGATLSEALAGAIATDPVARYGCVVAVNRPLTVDAVAELHGVFVDLLAAPAFAPEALAALEKRPKLKVVELSPLPEGVQWESKGALGRLLLQEVDRRPLVPTDLRLVTTHRATEAELDSLGFAWKVVRHAKSNAVVLAHGAVVVGIGSGQPTRVKAVELALEVAGPRAQGAVLASDAFFPFADGVEAAAAAGVTAILQPGGSLRDPEVIAAAERAGVAMYLTGWRVFRH